MDVNERTMSHFPAVAACERRDRDGLRLNLSMSLSLGNGKMGGVCNQTVLYIRGKGGTDKTIMKTISVGDYVVNNYF